MRAVGVVEQRDAVQLPGRLVEDDMAVILNVEHKKEQIIKEKLGGSGGGPPHLAEQGEGPGVRGLLGRDGHREAGAGVHGHSIQVVAQLERQKKKKSSVTFNQ